MLYNKIFTRTDAEALVNKYNGKLPPILLMGERCDGLFYKNDKLISIEAIKAERATDIYRLFYGCTNLINVPQVMEFSRVRSTEYMFGECVNLDLEFLMVVPELLSIKGMFYNCRKLKKSPKLIVTGKGIRDTSDLYSGCLLIKDLSGIDFSHSNNMSRMFKGCFKLKEFPSDFNTSSCKLMNQMFYDCLSLTKLPELDTSNVIQLEYAFEGCKKLKELPKLNTKNCTTIWGMCSGCESLKKIQEFDFSNLGDKLYTTNNLVKYVFGGCPDPLGLVKLMLGSRYLEFSNRDNKFTNFSGRIYNSYYKLNLLVGR